MNNKKAECHEAWLDFKAEWYPDENEPEVLISLRAAFEDGFDYGWFAAKESDKKNED